MPNVVQGVQVDTISAQGGELICSGDVATRLLQSDFNINALRTNATLRRDEWKQFDDVLIEVARQRMPLVAMLVEKGLTHKIDNGLGTMILEWEDVSDMEPADVSMAGVTRGEQDTLAFSTKSMPLPIIHKDFTLNIRKLMASRKLGQPLDVAQASLAGRLVAEKTEAMVILGHATAIGTSVIYGIDTVSNSSAITMTNNWDTTTSAAEYLVDILTGIAALQGDFMYGPYVLIVNETTHLRLQNDYDVAGSSHMTIAERLLKVNAVDLLIPSYNVPANHAYLVQLTKDVIDEVIGLQPTTVQWETQGGMQLHFKVMSIMIPRVRWTQTLQSGIAVIS